jgi:hypothetical protein
VTEVTDDGAEVDDVARAAREHLRQKRPGEDDRGGQVHPHDSLELVAVERRDRSVQAQAGAVDEHIDAAVDGERLLGQLERCRGVFEIGRERLDTRRAAEPGECLFFPTGRDDERAASGERLDRRASDPPGRPGHEADPAVERCARHVARA